MSVFAVRLIVIGAITSLTACVSVKTYQDNPEAQFTYRHSSSNFIVAWNTLQTGKDTAFEGLIKNVQNIEIRDIELNVMALDTDGKLLSEGAVLKTRVNLKKNDSVPFSVKLKDAVMEKGNVLQFILRYHIHTGSWYGRDGQNIFKVDAATGVAIEEQREQQN